MGVDMEPHARPAAAMDCWLDEVVLIDPLLRDPLDLGGRQARRRTIAKALVRELRLDDAERRCDREAFHPTTYELFVDMCEAVVVVRERATVHALTAARDVAGRSPRTASGRVDRTACATALLDLGWGQVAIRGGFVGEVLDDMAQRYVDAMAQRVLTMFRRWEKAGWLVEAL